MRALVRHGLHALVSLFVVACAAIVIHEATEYIAASAEAEKAVVNGWHAENWTSTGDTVEADVYGSKNRDCAFVQDWKVSALAMVDGKFAEVTVEFLRDATPGSTRPVGAQFFGRWRFTHSDGQHIQPGPIEAVITHDCGDQRVTVSTAGPFDFPG